MTRGATRRTLLAAAALAAAGFSSEVLAAAGSDHAICIVGVTVIDTATGDRLAGRRVVVREDRIEEVLDEADASDASGCDVVVDGRGGFLIPGLWDMHVHGSRRESLYPLYIANGVTGVREMFGPPAADELRARLEAAGVDAPRIVLGSPVLDGSPAIWPGSIEVHGADEARRIVAEQVARGADFLKVYQRLPRDAYFAILAEAGRLGVPVAGHVPNSVTAWEAAAAGQRSIEHLVRVPLACSNLDDQLAPARSFAEAIRQQVEASRSFDPARCRLFYEALKRNGTWIVPTFAAKRGDGWRDDPELRDDPRLRYFDGEILGWIAPSASAADAPPGSVADPAEARELFAFDQQIVGEMWRAGVGILAGTDSMNPFALPAFSLHDELGMLVDAGLTPLAALQAATSSAAAFLERSDRFGSVAVGKAADLVLLDADPLADIRNTTRIRAVLLAGKLFDREALDRLLERAAAAASAAGFSETE